MLVLSRMQDEGVTLTNETTGERIHVLVTRTQANGKVQLGITAGQQWHILRDELLDDQDSEAE